MVALYSAGKLAEGALTCICSRAYGCMRIGDSLTFHNNVRFCIAPVSCNAKHASICRHAASCVKHTERPTRGVRLRHFMLVQAQAAWFTVGCSRRHSRKQHLSWGAFTFFIWDANHQNPAHTEAQRFSATQLSGACRRAIFEACSRSEP